MNQLMENLEEYKIWQEGLELAEIIQEVTVDLSSSGSSDVCNTLNKMTHSVPCHLAEGFMMKNRKYRNDSIFMALNSLEEIHKSLVLTEQMGYIKRTHIHKIKKDIDELNRKIGDLLQGQQSVL
jgi:four helix bundle protein